MKRCILIIAIVVSAAGCRRLNPFAEQQLIAQVGDQKLYVSDVQQVFKTPLTPEDSLKLLEQYVDAWVMRQLKTQQADRLFRESEPEIDQMVEEYRISLLTRKLDQYHVDTKIDTALTDAAVQEYYDEHRADFVLDKTLVKGVIVKLPANHARRVQMSRLMVMGGEGYQDFLELAQKNGFEVHDITSWMDFAEFLRLLPTNNQRDYDDMLTRGGVQEMRDGDDLYLVLIRSVIRRGDTSPLEQVRDDIRRVILNQRREEIIRNYEDSIYRVAVEDKKLKLNLFEE